MNACKTVVLLAAALSVAAPAWAAEGDSAKATAAEAQSFPAIRVVGARNRTLVDRVIATGTIEAVEEVFIQPQVDGLQIEKLNADVGDVVKAGDTLATLTVDSLTLQKSELQATRAKTVALGAQYEAQLAEAVANQGEAIHQAERAERLVKSAAVPISQAEQLRATATAYTARVNAARHIILANGADVKVLDSQIADIDLKLARTDIKTPVGGVISARNAKIGSNAMVGATNPLFTIIRDNAIELKADVAEGDLLKLRPGQSVRMAIAGTSAEVGGKVRTVDPVVDAQTRLGTVKIILDDPAAARIGMYASAEIIISERNVLSLPLTAVTTSKDGSYVRRVVNDVVKMTKVETGVQDGDFIEIAKGLSAKDIVVEKAGVFVRDGDRISPVAEKTASN